MATFLFSGTIINDPVWEAIPELAFSIGEDIDIDLRQYLNTDFDGTITRKTGTDQLPPDLMIVDDRYLRGEVTEFFMTRTVRFVATVGSVSVDSGEVTMILEGGQAIWTNAAGAAIWTNAAGNPIWTGAGA